MCRLGSCFLHFAQILLATAERGCLSRSAFENPETHEFSCLHPATGTAADTRAPLYLGNMPFPHIRMFVPVIPATGASPPPASDEASLLQPPTGNLFFRLTILETPGAAF
jgi:hypothetical protein